MKERKKLIAVYQCRVVAEKYKEVANRELKTAVEQVWCGLVCYGMVWDSVVFNGMVWHGVVWYAVRYGFVWDSLVWNGMVRYVMVW